MKKAGQIPKARDKVHLSTGNAEIVLFSSSALGLISSQRLPYILRTELPSALDCLVTVHRFLE